MNNITINAENMHYKILNEEIRKLAKQGYQKIFIDNVCGQKFIGAGLSEKNIEITINGIPGNDLGCFMDGATIYVNGNVQDGTGNTMNSGRIIINGNAGDITGHSMRGGEIYIKGNAGYRVGIHMKEYKNSHPVIVIGGITKDFLGEYMAGGLIIVLNLEEKNGIVGELAGTGMHGGEIFLRGNIEESSLGKEVKIFSGANEIDRIQQYLKNFCRFFNISYEKIDGNFYKLVPVSKRPYGKIYAY